MYKERNRVVFCSVCRSKISKTTGCDHMTCSVCKYEFCWRCGSNYYQVFHCVNGLSRPYNWLILKFILVFLSLMLPLILLCVQPILASYTTFITFLKTITRSRYSYSCCSAILLFLIAPPYALLAACLSFVLLIFTIPL